MKKILLILGSILILPTVVFAASAFNSAQVGGSAANGFILQTNGSINTWVATSTIGVLTGTGTGGNCAQWVSTSILGSAGSPCGSGGGGSGGGTWSTTTSQVAGELINYPNNNTDIVTVGGNSTSTAKFIFDPNSQIGYFSGNVGIGTKSPTQALTIAKVLQLTATSSSLLSTDTSGNVVATTSIGTNLLSSNSVTINTSGTVSGGGTVALGGTLNLVGAGGGGSGTTYWATSSDNASIQPNVGQGIIVNASSTIGNGTAAGGLTINGNATTTNLFVMSSTTLQNFTALNSTSSNATSTGNFYASSSITTLGTVTANNFYDTSIGGSSCVGESSGILGTTNCVTSIAQTNGTAQTGNITLGTSTQVLYGVTRGINITNTAGAFTFTPSDSGTLSVAGGGTGAATLTGCLTGNGTGAITGSGTCNTSNATVSSVGLSSTNSTLTVGSTPVTTSGTITADINLAHGNTWSALQQFANASSTYLSAYQLATFGATATTTINGSGNLFVAGSTTLQNFTFLNATGTSATTTNFSNSTNDITIAGNYVTSTTTASFNIASTTLDALGKSFSVGTTTLLIRNSPTAIKLLGFYCVASTTGTAIVNFSHDNGNKTEYSTCTSGAYTSVATNNTWTAFEDFNVQASSTAGVVNRVTVTAEYVQTAP